MDNKSPDIDQPAKLSREAIEEFKKIYQEEFGRIITDAEALEMGQRLVNLFQILYRPLPDESNKGY